MRRASLLSGALLLLSLFGGGLIGCGFFDGGDAPTRDAGPPGSVGDPCATASGCRVGLACTDGTCQPLGTLIEGAACELALDCAPGLSCGAQRVCTAEGSAAEGEACAHGGDCQRGLTCVLEGFFAFCRPAGGEDINAPCTEPIECLAGLSCDQGACVAPDALPDGAVRPLPLPAWTGAECQVDEGPATAYFQIPTGDPAVDADFYTLPFPNDLRRTGGRLDLSGHPTAGSDVDPNAFARYLEEAGTSLNGFSTNPVAFFRFSAPYDWDTVAGSVRIVDVDPDSPDFGRDQALSWLTTSGSLSNYICPDWLAIRTGHGSPLRFGTTYAVIVTTAVQPTAAVGGTFQRSPDLDALLGATRPAAEPHASAWDAYAPLRDFIAADTALTEATVLNATVFTTQDYTAMMPAGRDAVRAAGLPPITDLVQCDAGVTSPCDDGSPSRACAAADGSYIELHGRIELPIFQMGTPPYRTPAEGGAVILSVDGQPGIERREPVCFALTIPTSAMPAEGWPVLLHGHGTGGSFRSGIEDGLASDLASATTPAALLGFDLPQHGERRAGDPTPPELLVYNFENPAAANGNMIQGAMDLFTVVSFLEAGIIDAATSPTGAEIRFDPTRIALFAHSQGASHAALMIQHEPALSAAVLSGLGGDLTQSLRTKSSPMDIAALIPFALFDADRNGRLVAGDFNPALAILQSCFDRSDAVNYARHLHREPLVGRGGRHVFMTYGLGDTFSTEQTMKAYSKAARMTQVSPLLSGDFGLPLVDPPLSLNVTVEGVDRTVGLRQYDPGAIDGHFVSTQTPEGRADVLLFLEGALSGGAPQIGN